MGTSQGYISSLENSTKKYVRLDSLQRYARAVGKRLVIGVE